ncbi:MFS transporter [Candidatus Ozemobacteraceae bacterium]|nr:MFS transporter [Candidatus Ozemobacteraceae bacterium]
MTNPNSDVASPGFFQTLTSFGRAFWCSNVIELLERWAYYGVRGGIAVYMVAAATVGGLEFSHLQKANIFFWWAAFQSLLPTVIGGHADHYGHKRTVAFAIAISVVGYISMALVNGYWPFFIACMLVATGTAVFKPGIQGILANSTTKENATLGWSFFYMIVNIGGFTGPLIAGYLRLMSWKYVFITSACIHSLNFITLFFFDEPDRGHVAVEHNDRNLVEKASRMFKEFWQVLFSSLKNLFDPPLMMFLAVFSGFWLMFMQLFDLLPNFITDWVDTSAAVLFFGNLFGKESWITLGQGGQQIPAEWLINLDAFAIIFLMLPIGWIFGRMRPVAGMILGIFIASAGLVVAGYTMNVWICALGIFVFAIGEMIASPRKSEYLSMLAPPGKKGLYMGYVNFPQGIGWMLGSSLAGPIYQYYGDKTTLARQYLVENLNMAKETVAQLPLDQVLPTLGKALNHHSVQETTRFLFSTYHPERIWFVFAAVGILSMLGMLAYDMVFEKKRQQQADAHSATPVA